MQQYGGSCVSYKELFLETSMIKVLLWLILAILCWPLALLVLILYPLIWILMLPFRLVGITVGALLAFVRALFMFPARVLQGPAGHNS